MSNNEALREVAERFNEGSLICYAPDDQRNRAEPDMAELLVAAADEYEALLSLYNGLANKIDAAYKEKFGEPQGPSTTAFDDQFREAEE